MPIGLMQELLVLLKGAVAIAGVVGLMGMYIPQVTIHHQTNALKKNIRSVDNQEMLAAVMQLTPSRFQFLTPDELQQQGLPRLVASEGEQLGLLAQNLEALFPDREHCKIKTKF